MEESTMVVERARPLIKALAKVSADLNEASDRYTEELKTIEAELEKLNIGIEVCLDRVLKETDWKEEEDDEGHVEKCFRAWYLGYDKHQEGLSRRWRLLVYEYRVTGSPEERSTYTHTLVDKTPLLDTSRDLRIASADHIIKLLEKIESEAKKKTETLRKVSDAQ